MKLALEFVDVFSRSRCDLILPKILRWLLAIDMKGVENVEKYSKTKLDQKM